MSTETAIGHLRALWRTERIIADIRLKYLLGSFGLKAFAALFAVLGLLLFELGGYFALIQAWSAIASAVLLGAFNMALAAILILLAVKRPPPRELALALEVENSAIVALQAEARTMQANGFGGFHHPWGAAAAAVLPQLIPLVIRALKKSKTKDGEDRQS